MIYTYKPSEVVLSVCEYVLPGLTDISVDWSSEKFSVIKGIRGKHTRVKTLDTSCTITISVSQTSVTNDVLSSIVSKDGSVEGEEQALANLSIFLKDAEGKTSFASDECFISQFPSIYFNDSLQDRQWIIHCLSTYDVVVGSNQIPIGDIF